VETFAPFRGKLKNAVVLTSEPAPPARPANPQLEGVPLTLAAQEERMDPAIFQRSAFRPRLYQLLKEEGAACLLRDSRKEHGLLDMTTAGAGGTPFTAAPIPAAFITHEGYSLLWRLLKRGPVTVELDIRNQLTPGPVTVYNTVAELPGAEKADEVVILGGHLDSWDLGTGTTDNGTGCMAILEAARAMKALGLKPKRTIRFILFNGEEQGLHGSREYAKAHEAEMPKVSGMLVHDYGTGRVTHLPLQGNFQCGAVLEAVTRPLRSVGFEGVRGGQLGGTDHLSFDRYGVPAFACGQGGAEYRKTHHTQSDTFEKAWKDDLLQGTMVLAVWAYNVASIPEMLPRRR
jgi:carboxypeptidase Q